MLFWLHGTPSACFVHVHPVQTAITLLSLSPSLENVRSLTHVLTRHDFACVHRCLEDICNPFDAGRTSASAQANEPGSDPAAALGTVREEYDLTQKERLDDYWARLEYACLAR
jgi:hypothetical protein